MQQKRVDKKQQVLIYQNLSKTLIQQAGVDKLDIDKLQKVPTGLNSSKTKVDKLDVDKLVPISVDLSKLSNIAKNYVA